jgi:hypothetical protein
MTIFLIIHIAHIMQRHHLFHNNYAIIIFENGALGILTIACVV